MGTSLERPVDTTVPGQPHGEHSDMEQTWALSTSAGTRTSVLVVCYTPGSRIRSIRMLGV